MFSLTGLLLAACYHPAKAVPPFDSPVARHGRLGTAGNKVIDEDGNAVRLRGMSLFWSQWSEGSKYYNSNVVQWLYQDWHVNLIRIAMGVEHGGYLAQPAAERARVKAVVDAAIEVGIYVIIDWHDHNAQNHVAEARTFFANVSETYGSAPNVIFEIFNEPVDQSWSNVIKPYHEEVIPVIRKHSKNLIILGTRTWSQEVEEASLDPVLGTNLAYTLHFYANTHRDFLRQKARNALANNIPLFVTEWGTCSADGNGDLDLPSAQTWLSFLEENHISDANWAISDKAEKCAALIPGSDAGAKWPSDRLTGSGFFMRASIRDFHASLSTTKPATTSWASTIVPSVTTTTQLRSSSSETPITTATLRLRTKGATTSWANAMASTEATTAQLRRSGLKKIW